MKVYTGKVFTSDCLKKHRLYTLFCRACVQFIQQHVVCEINIRILIFASNLTYFLIYKSSWSSQRNSYLHSKFFLQIFPLHSRRKFKQTLSPTLKESGKPQVVITQFFFWLLKYKKLKQFNDCRIFPSLNLSMCKRVRQVLYLTLPSSRFY